MRKLTKYVNIRPPFSPFDGPKQNVCKRILWSNSRIYSKREKASFDAQTLGTKTVASAVVAVVVVFAVECLYCSADRCIEAVVVRAQRMDLNLSCFLQQDHTFHPQIN